MMKKLKVVIITLCLLGCLTSCSKENGIVGRWEYSGEYGNVSAEFFEDGSCIINGTVLNWESIADGKMVQINNGWDTAVLEFDETGRLMIDSLPFTKAK